MRYSVFSLATGIQNFENAIQMYIISTQLTKTSFYSANNTFIKTKTPEKRKLQHLSSGRWGIRRPWNVQKIWKSRAQTTKQDNREVNDNLLANWFQAVQVATLPCQTRTPRAEAHGGLQPTEGKSHRTCYVGMGHPSYFGPEKDDKCCFCIDYGKLNSIAVQDTYPLPINDEHINTLDGSEYYTTLDVYCGHRQMPSHKNIP